MRHKPAHSMHLEGPDLVGIQRHEVVQLVAVASKELSAGVRHASSGKGYSTPLPAERRFVARK